MAPGETLDPDRAATVAELLRLPKVGPALARAIVADREAKGPFHTLQGLDRVSGIGPKLLEAIGPYLAFQGGTTAGGVSGCPGSPVRPRRPPAGSISVPPQRGSSSPLLELGRPWLPGSSHTAIRTGTLRTSGGSAPCPALAPGCWSG